MVVALHIIAIGYEPLFFQRFIVEPDHRRPFSCSAEPRPGRQFDFPYDEYASRDEDVYIAAADRFTEGLCRVGHSVSNCAERFHIDDSLKRTFEIRIFPV